MVKIKGQGVSRKVDTSKKYDVLFIGTLADNDLVVANHLSRLGLKCVIMRPLGEEIRESDRYLSQFQNNDIIYYKHRWSIIKIARKSRLILCFAGLGKIGVLYLPCVRRLMSLPPVINITTGSDITELAADKSLKGALYRNFLRCADLNWCANYPHAIKNVLGLGLRNVVFMRFPYYIPGDLSPERIEQESGSIRFIHASNLDWKINDSGLLRNSSKGNNRFIRAFARAAKNGIDISCIILERGPDVEEAKKLIKQLGVEDRFVWKPNMTRTELVGEFARADVVVDQFDVGGFGGIAVEAMMMAKPVMIHLQENCQKLLYSERPPVLNCYTEEEIYQQIMACQKKEDILDLGRRAKEWVYKYHHRSTCLDQFLFYYTLLTGHEVVDYGWDDNPYASSPAAS